MSRTRKPFPASDRDKKVVVYCRVSSLEQAEGYSPDAQLRVCADLVKRKKLTLAHEPFVEVAATDGVLPVLDRMVAFLRENPQVGGVVVQCLDRLARDMRELAVILRGLHVRPWVVDNEVLENGSGKLVRGVMAIAARQYFDLHREETLKGLKVKVGEGRMPFRAPHGYRPGTDGVPELDPASARALRRSSRTRRPGSSRSTSSAIAQPTAATATRRSSARSRDSW